MSNNLPNRRIATKPSELEYSTQAREARLTNRLRKAFEKNLIRRLNADEATPTDVQAASAYLTSMGELALRHQQTVAAMSREQSPMELMLASVAKRNHVLAAKAPVLTRT